MSLFGVGGREAAVFSLTPHKIALCQLIQVFAPPAQHALPLPFTSLSQHNRLGLFLFSLTRSCEDYLEPGLEELMNQLKSIDGLSNDWLHENLFGDLSSLTSADDLFNFFDKLQGVIVGPEGVNMEGDQIFLDPSSHLGIYLRCCILTFNSLTFEGICHLLTNIGIYCNSVSSAFQFAEEELDGELESEEEEFNNESNMMQMQLNEQFLPDISELDKYSLSFESDTPKNTTFNALKSSFDYHTDDNLREENNLSILRSAWQVEGYLNQQADLLEKDANSVPLNSFNAALSQLQKLAPDLYRTQYLQYLNALHHDDFALAVDSLHHYFDHSAGQGGLFSSTSSQTPNSTGIILGRYEAALLCLGTLHSRFGHSQAALDALTEAICFSQTNNDDSCLAYTLSAMCSLLSQTGMNQHWHRSIGSIGSLYSLGAGAGTPSSTQQLLLVLLKRSLKRAEGLKLSSLLAFDRLALAKFDLKHVKMPLLSFGPKASTNLKTCPIDVCKELRLSTRVLTEFGSDVSLSNDNGAFSTSWLKNLKSSTNNTNNNDNNILNLSINDFDIFNFHSQPSPVPASVLQLVGSSYLLRSTAWEHYGSAPLVRANALVYATCFASSLDLSLAYVKLIQHLAVFKGYSEAFNALRLAEEKFSSISKPQIRLLRLQLLHDRALHRGQVKLAQQICDEFRVLASSGNGIDLDLKTEAGIRHARTLLASKQFTEAEAMANSLFCTCYKNNMQVENATILLLLSEIHKKSGNVMLGLPYALAALSFCKAFNLDLLEACATLAVAELWLTLGPVHTRRAVDLVHRSLPWILGHGGLELRARGNLAVAKGHLADPAFDVSRDSSVVLDPLTQAAEELQILEYHEMAAEAYYLIAMVYNSLGQVEEREETSAYFRTHIYSLQNPNEEEHDLYLFSSKP
ncbi:hypothetical protein LUZ60_005095 [Juncus effusus]|nr:hypothetical protein LUZ60_005095 [Juncus effusus]